MIEFAKKKRKTAVNMIWEWRQIYHLIIDSLIYAILELLRKRLFCASKCANTAKNTARVP